MSQVDEIADILELQTWAAGKPTSMSSIKEALESALSDPSEDEAETLAQQVMEEFARRQQLLEDAYPFDCDGYKLTINHLAPEDTTYLFCVALSHLPAAEIENEQRAQQFETIVKNAAVGFFGGKGLRIGAPWRTDEIPTYASLLDKAVELIPDLGARSRDTAPGGGDAGWDILIVKSFKDEQFPRFIALGNCATGKRDWMQKWMEKAPTLWWSYFDHAHWSAEITFFAVPFLMDKNARLSKNLSSAMIFDRFRICEFAPTSIGDAAVWVNGQRANAMNLALV